ncbi:MAG: bifunctional [glutamine synthetase] adenylyltransferase/[glutamine synthetase]-adenylyl-L-tyrosine phosphorylase [Acetobacteraceae bacterium]|nr:bifunctional [glutamine synthetase] adenylyltransferase/[glutamine synthetase]-adenylyl-L-tyrosine phosphorylase [Acetobacteraceae bacterium]
MTRQPTQTWPASWPAPVDLKAADLLIERFAERGPEQAALAAGAGRAVLGCLGGNSPYLSDLALRESDSFARVLREGPSGVVQDALAHVAALPHAAPQPQLAALMRQAKRQVALATALADIGGIWTLERVTEALSDLAETTLRAAVAHLLAAGHARGDLVLPDPTRPEWGSGFVVLAMGKLGARELNYSSDIDLVLLHDQEAGLYRGDQATSWFSRLARNLVTLMEARDANGYVFRTDLRLRPDPAATPPSLSVHAALIYYESMGQNWERAAMLKARPVAGDVAAGWHFLDAIRPFVWRRHLDFAAIADIHAMKRRIDEHRKTGLAASAAPHARVVGHNVKLGQGGIREIEFLVQTLQLVWGGRNPELRDRRTLPALRLLARAGHLTPQTARDLAISYRALRRVEHRLQMVADRQTHVLPDRLHGLADFAVFFGEPNAERFAAWLLRHLERVSRCFDELFSTLEGGDGHGLVFGDVEARHETLAKLREMGFAEPARIADVVAGWLAGRARALRSERARELLGTVLPSLLTALARQREPDAAFMRFARFIENLPAGVQILSLVQRNPGLAARIADVLGAAPQLAEHLARTPSALEGLLALPDPTPAARRMRLRLAAAADLEEAVAAVRGTVRERDFAISVATLEGRMNADEAGLLRADLADAAMSALLPLVLKDFARRHGEMKGGGLAVVALGKAGGRETMAGSDLDLMLIYDHKPKITHSEGSRAMPASQWFIHAVRAYVTALTSSDAEGPTYEVDMRLRPSGNKGPVAVSLASFTGYHARDAWTWERMSLTRARVVAGPPALRRKVEAAIRVAISSGDPAKIRSDAVAMRARVLRDLPASGPWDVKQRRGGQVEVEFIAQVLQLLHGPVAPTLRVAVAGLEAQGHIAPDDAGLLIRADRIWRALQSILRLTHGGKPPQDLAPSAIPAILEAMRHAGVEAVDVGALQIILERLARDVRALFVRLIGDPEI